MSEETTIKKRGNPALTDPIKEPGVNSQYIKFTMGLMKMPKVDLYKPEEVEKRLYDYFDYCFENDMKPAVAGMAMALGMHRQDLWSIKTGAPDRYKNLPVATCDTIKKGYENMEILWENYMLNGKINPVSGIFLGKNNFGYKDQQEHILTPSSPLGDNIAASDITNKYDELPE